MKALTFDPRDNHFQVRDVPMPEPGLHDVVVKVDACGLNPVDAQIGRWKSRFPQMNEFWVPGLDISGQIANFGTGVSGWKVGDRVLCHGDMSRPHGGFAEYTVQDSSIIIPHPDVKASIAAATPCAGWTAWRAIHDKLRASDKDSILVTGGSGGVGGFAIQIAKYLGLKTIIATCSAKNREYVIKLGATHAIDYQSEDIVARVLEMTGQRGVTLGLDTVGFDNDITVSNALAFEGQMVELVDTVRPSEYKDAFQKGLGFHQFSLGSGHRYGKSAQETLVATGRAFSTLIEQEIIRVTISSTIILDEVAPALNEMLNQRTVGKIVMVV
jgi:NADPH2:quinone reductase